MAEPAGGTPMRSRSDRIELSVRHAITGVEVNVVLPGKAKFKHAKRAIARHLGSDEIQTTMQLMRKVRGSYMAYKDNHYIGDVRQVIAMNVEFSTTSKNEID